MNNDRQIIISAAGSRKATVWPAQTMYWSELVEKLRIPVRGTETLTEYLHLPKSKQDGLKDVGGFVGGKLKDSKRKAGNVLGRDIITLDMDNIQPGGTQDVLKRVEALGCAYAVYSTRKHEEARPRLRLLIPTSHTCTADEYEPIARKLAGMIGMELCDPTTFQAHRLMYWPNCCKDSQYVYQYADKPFLDVDGLLSLYKNWRDTAEWPQVPGMQQKHVKLAARQSDPTAKSGIVGAFCKVYNIYNVMEAYLPGVYEPVESSTDRYTYMGGSTVGGAIVYENGTFLYSHHATDPASERLCNSFDLVRLHKFGSLDDNAKPDTPANKLPSYEAMCKLAVQDTKVSALLNQERYEKATEDFKEDATTTKDTEGWISKLQLNSSSGLPLKTIKNVRVVLENDPQLKGRIRLNLFANKLYGIAPLPWELRNKEEGMFEWIERDYAGLKGYIESILQFSSDDKIETALAQTAAKQAFDPVVDYLESLEWDGNPRLDTLFIDYLGSDDTPYTRAVTRKAFTAAVARAMVPGIKFDNMTVIQGPQGIGKSTLLKKMGKDWFSDSVNTVEGKEAAELLQGVWIIEIGELGAYSKADVRLVKLFLSKCDDQYRAAYAHVTEKHPRRCVFFGTTNDLEYLRDTSGNRRFWPITCMVQKPKKSVFENLDNEIDQIWAEAVLRWRLGEPLYLSQELEKEADKRRAAHMEQDPLQGQIESFIEQPIPEDWGNWSLERRLMFWGGQVTGKIKLVPRDRVCAIEIWRECLHENKTNIPLQEARRINAALKLIPGWEKSGTMRFGAGYGIQRGYKRTAKIDNLGPKLLLNANNFVNRTTQDVNNSDLDVDKFDNFRQS